MVKQLVKPSRTQEYKTWAIVNEDCTQFYCQDQEMGYPSISSNIQMSHAFHSEDSAKYIFNGIKNELDKTNELYKAFAKGRVVPITVEVFVTYSEGHN